MIFDSRGLNKSGDKNFRRSGEIKSFVTTLSLSPRHEDTSESTHIRSMYTSSSGRNDSTCMMITNMGRSEGKQGARATVLAITVQKGGSSILNYIMLCAPVKLDLLAV